MSAYREFILKPPVFLGMQYDGTEESIRSAARFVRQHAVKTIGHYDESNDDMGLVLKEGGDPVHIRPGDWVVKTGKDEFEVLDDSDFRRIYQAKPPDTAGT